MKRSMVCVFLLGIGCRESNEPPAQESKGVSSALERAPESAIGDQEGREPERGPSKENESPSATVRAVPRPAIPEKEEGADSGGSSAKLRMESRVPRRGAVVPPLPAGELDALKATLTRVREFEWMMEKQRFYRGRCQFAISQTLKDGWGRKMEINCRGGWDGLVLLSAGPDGKFLSPDDVKWIGSATAMVDDRW